VPSFLLTKYKSRRLPASLPPAERLAGAAIGPEEGPHL
jgi:hypothetical protein